MSGEFDAGGLSILDQKEGPGIVAVARQHDQIGIRLLGGFQQARACRRISVPAVHPHRHALPGGADIVLERLDRVGCGG